MPIRILFVLENFYPAHRAGTETYVLNLAKGLLDYGFEVHIAIAAVGEISSQYIFEQLHIHCLSVPHKISTHELNGLQPPSNLNEFGSLLHHLQPHIVHFHSFSRSFTHFHLKAAAETGTKIVFTAHLGGIFCARGDLQLYGKKQCNAHISQFRCSSCFASQKHSYTKSFAGAVASFLPLKHKIPALNLIPNKLQSMQYLSEYSHTCIAIANWIEQAFRINGIQQTQVLTQAIDSKLFTPKPNANYSQKIRLGFIGRMNPSKGFYILLNALKSMNDEFDLHCITIKDITEGEYYTEMKKMFHALGFANWQENLKHSEINIAMDSWDMLVLPSHHEVAPLSILEAFAKKIPVLGSDYPAIAEMINDGQTGLLFRNKDVDDLSQKLKYIAQNRELLNIWSQNILPVKDISVLINEHIDLYSKILNITK